MNTNVISDNQLEIGMGATIQIGSDRYPATVIDIYHNDKRITLQEDLYIRTDNNGWSDIQTYEYKRNPVGEIYHATLRADGSWRLTGRSHLVKLGKRERYYDFSF